MRIKIYQLNPKKDTRRVRFESYEQTEQRGGVHASEYKCVFHGDVKARHLDDIYNHFNGRTKPYTGTFQGHSLSMSDVVEVLGNIPEMYGRIDYLDTNGEVGEEYWIATKEKFEHEFYDCLDYAIPFTPHRLAEQHIKLTEPGCHFCDSVGWVKCENFNPSECEDMDGLRVLTILPGRTPVETRIIDDPEHWQRAIRGRGEDAFMEIVCPFDDNVAIVYNKDSVPNGMAGNRRLYGDIVAGPMYIVGDNGDGNFCDLTDEQVNTYSNLFAEPEEISDEEVQETLRFTFFTMT